MANGGMNLYSRESPEPRKQLPMSNPMSSRVESVKIKIELLPCRMKSKTHRSFGPERILLPVELLAIGSRDATSSTQEDAGNS